MLKSDLYFCHWNVEDKLSQFYTLSKSLVQLNTISNPSIEAHTHPHRQMKKTTKYQLHYNKGVSEVISYGSFFLMRQVLWVLIHSILHSIPVKVTECVLSSQVSHELHYNVGNIRKSKRESNRQREVREHTLYRFIQKLIGQIYLQ